MLNPLSAPTPADKSYAALFVDFENIFYFLQNEYADLPDLTEYALEILRNLREYLENELNVAPIVRYAYADFEKLSAAPLGSLYLMGIETRNVLGTGHKNAADMRLSIDAMQVLYTRPEITTFVFVAGDRDYIPVIQHIQTQARTVKAVAFRGSLSGDLLQNIREEHFVDARSLISEDALLRLEKDTAYAREAARIREEARAQRERDYAEERKKMLESEGEVPPPRHSPQLLQTHPQSHHSKVPSDAQKKADAVRFAPIQDISNEDQIVCLRVMLGEYGNHPEIWLSPFLRRLTDALPALADYERKALLGELEDKGAIAIEMRQGEPYDYRVIIVNYNHPAVREVNPG